MCDHINFISDLLLSLHLFFVTWAIMLCPRNKNITLHSSLNGESINTTDMPIIILLRTTFSPKILPDEFCFSRISSMMASRRSLFGYRIISIIALYHVSLFSAPSRPTPWKIYRGEPSDEHLVAKWTKMIYYQFILSFSLLLHVLARRLVMGYYIIFWTRKISCSQHMACWIKTVDQKFSLLLFFLVHQKTHPTKTPFYITTFYNK